MPSAILVDLDDTLADDRHAMTSAILGLARVHEMPVARGATELADYWIELTELHWRRYRAGEITLQEQRRERLRHLFQRPLGETEADRVFGEYLQLYERHWRLAPGAGEFLARTAAVPKAVVSNGEGNQVARKLEVLGIGPHFSAVITPELAGATKPKPEIFLFALQRLGAKPAQALMVGDSYELDIAPSEALGMKTFHVCNTVEGRTIGDAADAAEAADRAD